MIMEYVTQNLDRSGWESVGPSPRQGFQESLDSIAQTLETIRKDIEDVKQDQSFLAKTFDEINEKLVQMDDKASKNMKRLDKLEPQVKELDGEVGK